MTVGFILLFQTSLKAQSAKNTGRIYFYLSPAFLTSYNLYIGLQPGVQYCYKNWAADAEVAFPLFNDTKNGLAKGQYRRYGFELKKIQRKDIYNCSTLPLFTSELCHP